MESNKTAMIWPLITGLAVGFAVGRETGGPRMAGGSSEPAAESAPAAAPAAAPAGKAAPSKTYRAEKDFPAGWLKSADLSAVAGLSFDGMNDAQKATALQALNERDCECGCNMGSLATCAKKDPNCPRSPVLAKLAVEKAKGGASLTDVLAAVDARQKELGAPGGAGGAPPPPPSHVDLAPGELKDAPAKGPAAAPVSVVIFSDFQCPFCSRVEPTLAQLETEYKGKLRFVWKNYPLPFHDKAIPAAECAMAAHEQGKFWPMHDKLFANQQNLDQATCEKHAQELGLNVGKLKASIEAHKWKAKIDSDMKYGSTVGVSGTPAFFVNGNFLSGAQPVDAFKKLIDAELAKKK